MLLRACTDLTQQRMWMPVLYSAIRLQYWISRHTRTILRLRLMLLLGWDFFVIEHYFRWKNQKKKKKKSDLNQINPGKKRRKKRRKKKSPTCFWFSADIIIIIPKVHPVLSPWQPLAWEVLILFKFYKDINSNLTRYLVYVLIWREQHGHLTF